jgi:hypothetical protein
MSRKDINTTAFDIVQQAIGEKPPLSPKQIATQESGRKGGRIRMAALTPEQRADMARVAATARWKKTPN